MIALAACNASVMDDIQPAGDDSQRPTVHVSFTAALGSQDSSPAHRVNAMTNGAGITFEWQGNDQLGAYIQKSNGTIVRAGTVTTTGEAGRGLREFSGDLLACNAGEHYVYMAPLTDGVINYANQSGAFGSTAHLNNILPIVWHDDEAPILLGQVQAYVLTIDLQFNEDPGTISSVQVRSMDMGNDGTTPDRIFPTTFAPARLANRVNNTLPTRQDGTSLGEGYTNVLTFTPTGDATATKGGNLWTARAFIAVPSVKNLNVFSSKYNIKVVAQHGNYYSEYRSFPGQQDVTGSDKNLAMLADGYRYNITARCSRDGNFTVINEKYMVNILTGMWNDYGKPYDPFGFIVYKGDGTGDALSPSLPTQLTANKAAILSRYNNNASKYNTPTYLGAGTNSLYDLSANNAALGTVELRQSDVVVNNIEITRDTEVFVTFISEFGWNQNLLGYYHYPTSSTPSEQSSEIQKNIIFPNYSKPYHPPFNLNGDPNQNTQAKNNIGTPAQAPLHEFETVRLLYKDPATGFTSTTFPAGTTIGFMMMIDTKANEDQPKKGYDLLNWGQWRLFTNTRWNTENCMAYGSNADWPTYWKPPQHYYRDNFFASGDVCIDGTPVPGLAYYGVKDTGNNDANYAYGAMIFMVSTGDPAAMQTHNKAYFNIGTGNQVIAK